MTPGTIPNELPARIRKAMQDKRWPDGFPAMYKKSLVTELNQYLESCKRTVAAAREIDPFWWYEPSDGSVNDEGMELLGKYIKREDIPARFDSALDVHKSQAGVVGVAGANQSGKTMTGMINDMIKACRVLPKSLQGVADHRVPKKECNRVRVTCKDYTNGILNHNLPLYRKWVPKDYLIDKDWNKSWSDKRNTLTLVDPYTKKVCGTIEFMSNQAKAETFQGPPVDRARYDEEPNKDIYDENLMRFTTADKLDIELNMTPTAGLTWVYDDLFREERTKTGEKIEWFKLVAVANRYANFKVLDEAYSQIRDYDVLKMRALGEFVSLSGLVYGRYFKRSDHVIKPEDIGLGKGIYLKCNCEAQYYEHAHHRSGCPYLDYVAYLGVDPHEVKASTALILALDRNGNHYVDTTYREERTMTEVAKDINAMLKGYRYGFGKCDPHADSEKTAFDNRNIWTMLTKGPHRIPRLRKADAYKGSRLAGVDIIKGLLMPHPITKRPRLYIIDRPENELLIQSFRTLQRDTYRDEFAKGEKDEIMEGKHDHHACLRYILQTKLNWTPHDIPVLNAIQDVIAAGF